MNSAKTFAKWNIHEKKSSHSGGATISAIDENRVVITYGFYITTAEVFDFRDGSTMKLPDMPVCPKHKHHQWSVFYRSSVVLDNYIYVWIGLKDALDVHDEIPEETVVHRIDIGDIGSSSSVWETKIFYFIGDERETAASVVHDGWIYLLGGYRHAYYLYTDDDRSSSLSNYFRFKPHSLFVSSANEVWEEIERGSMNEARSGHAAVTVGEKIYIIGGRDDHHNSLNSMEIFDPSTNTFEYGPPLPIALCDITAVAIGEYIVVNGATRTGLEYTFIYDIKEILWKSIDSPSYNFPRHSDSRIVLQNNKIVVCGGYDFEGHGLDTIEWIFLDELLFGKRWDRRKEFILLRQLLHKERAFPEKENKCSYSSDLIQIGNDDVFRLVLEFL